MSSANSTHNRSSFKLEAGLPNITGEGAAQFFANLVDLNSGGGYKEMSSYNLSGAFTLKTWQTKKTATGYGDVWYDGTYGFNAHNSNPIYGNSSTVQPPAIQLIPQIKY